MPALPGLLFLWLTGCAAGTLRPTGGGSDSGPGTPSDDGESVPPSDGDPGAVSDDLIHTDLFDTDLIHTLALEMDPDAWLDVRDNPSAKNWHEAHLTWIHGETGAEHRLEQIGIRAFGAGSLRVGKPALKLSFDKYIGGQRLGELEQLKLDNSSQDVGFMNERIASELMREWGLPAARTGWARVQVNGEAAGFFLSLEPIDDRFLDRVFGNDDGVLYSMRSGYWGQGLNPTTDPLTYYEVQTPVDTDGSDIIALTEVVATGSDDALLAAMDLEQFTRISVGRSVLGSLDAFSADGNNFYLYNDSGYWRQIPWDMDADLGYPSYFTTALAVPPSSPWDTSPWSYNPLTGADYTDPVLTRHMAMGADPDALALELVQALDWEEVDARIVASAALIGDEVDADVLGYGPYFDTRIANLRLWLHQRLSGFLGADVAQCGEPEGQPASELGPAGNVGWGSLMVDETDWGPGFSVAGEHYCRGIFAHAPSTVTLTVPEGASTLRGMVGLQDWNQECGDGATFSVVQGGDILWQSGVLGTYDPAEDMGEVAVSAGTLSLITGVVGDYSCDTTAWLDLRVE